MNATGSATILLLITQRTSRRVRFYGWPWYYIGVHEDPRHKDERTDLKDQINDSRRLDPDSFCSTPDRCSNDGASFPAQYKGNAFRNASWVRGNRSRRTGLQKWCACSSTIAVSRRANMRNFNDRLCHFLTSKSGVRPVGVACRRGTDALCYEDGNGTICEFRTKNLVLTDRLHP